MTDLAIRDATPEDAAALAPLLAVLVATRGPRVVGFVTVHATPVLHRPTPVGRITAIAVATEEHGSGVGRLLVGAAESHCAAQGWTRLEVTSGPTHTAAHAFYRHLGYADQGIRFARVLTPPYVSSP